MLVAATQASVEPLQAAPAESGEVTGAGTGAALFDGGPEAAAVEVRIGQGGILARASRFPCRSCHGRDGFGGREGGTAIPAIDPSVLAVPSPRRPAYDVASFATALREGIDPAGRHLDPVMPRYRLTGVEAAELMARLTTMARHERTGVMSDSVTLGIPSSADPSLVAAFRRAWMERGDPRLFGRRLATISIQPAAEDPPVFAVLFDGGPFSKGGSDLADPRRPLGVPSLFPFRPLDGGEDPERTRGLFASRADQAAALLQAAPANALILVDQAARTLIDPILASRSEARPVVLLEELVRPCEASAAVVLAGRSGWQALAAGQQLTAKTTVYGSLDDAAGVLRVLQSKGVPLILADPRPVQQPWRQDRPALERFATTAAEVLEEVLAAAGRTLTRGGLSRAFARLALKPANWPALDYASAPLTGSREVRLIRVGERGPE